MKEPLNQRISDFMAGKGFYIVLFLCVAAIGISGYYLYTSLSAPDEEVPVAGHVQVTVTPPAPEHTLQPQRPSVTARPVPTAAPTAAAKPASTPVPSAVPSAVPPAASSFFTWPVKGDIVHPYSVEALAYDETMGDWRTHEGVDLAAEMGTKVLAASDGSVASVLQDDLMGTTVTLDHGNGLVSVYANLSPSPLAEAGDTVKAGDVLGTVGNTAIAESAQVPHLHFAMWKNDLPVDPADYLPQR